MLQKLMKNKIIVAVGAIISCALWGISTPIVKLGYKHIDSTHVPSLLLWVGLIFLVAGVMTVGGYSLYKRRFVFPKKESLKGITVVSVLQTVMQYSLLYIGLTQTTSVKGAILKSTDVFFVALLASLVFRREKLTAKKLVSCIIGFAGIIVMNLNGLSFDISPLGDGLVVLAILSYSVAVIMTNIFSQKESPIVFCGYQMSLGGTILAAVGFIAGGRFDFVGMLPVFVGLVLIYAVSYTVWTVLLKYNPASSVTIFSFMTPVFGVIFSALLLTEDGGVAITNLIIALILVCAGIILWGYERPVKNPKDFNNVGFIGTDIKYKQTVVNRMKVIFLDIDGVLNTPGFEMASTGNPPFIDPKHLTVLKEILDKSGAVVVLSSFWKKGWEKGRGFDLVFSEAGITIGDVTPNLGFKGTEIAAWLKAHPEIDSFAIIDDSRVGWGELISSVVFTNPESGLTPEHIPLVLKKLGE